MPNRIRTPLESSDKTFVDLHKDLIHKSNTRSVTYCTGSPRDEGVEERSLTIATIATNNEMPVDLEQTDSSEHANVYKDVFDYDDYYAYKIDRRAFSKKSMKQKPIFLFTLVCRQGKEI